MTALYIILAVTAVLLCVVILSFLGPEQSERRFWQAVQKLRAIIDKVSYAVICALSIGFLGLMLWSMVSSLVENYQENLSVIGVLVSVLIILALGLLVFFGVRSLRKERKKGTLCACSGDCSTCKIQCRTNPNYYGIQQKGEPK